MNDATTILFGDRGQPAATVDGDGLFNAKGDHIGFFEDELIFNVEDGGFIGSYVNGVVYDADGQPQGFRKGAKPGIPMVAPGVSRLPPRLRSPGKMVKDEAPADIPDFLRSKLKALSFK